MKLPRFLHKWYAKLEGYFWLPCPLCNRYFGGHEWKHPSNNIPTGPTTATGICSDPACQRMGYLLRKDYQEKRGDDCCA